MEHKYPRLDFKSDKRRRLTENQISDMRKYREQGKSYRWIGEQFGVSQRTAHYHTDPSWALEQNKKRYKLLQRQYEEDPDLIDKKRKDWSNRFLQRTKEDNEAIIFKAKNTYRWKKKRYHLDDEFAERQRKLNRESYHRHKRATSIKAKDKQDE